MVTATNVYDALKTSLMRTNDPKDDDYTEGVPTKVDSAETGRKGGPWYF